MSGLSSFNPIEAAGGAAHFGGGGVAVGTAVGMGGGMAESRMCPGGAASELGQSLMPYLSVEMRTGEA